MHCYRTCNGFCGFLVLGMHQHFSISTYIVNVFFKSCLKRFKRFQILRNFGQVNRGIFENDDRARSTVLRGIAGDQPTINDMEVINVFQPNEASSSKSTISAISVKFELSAKSVVLQFKGANCEIWINVFRAP